MLSLPQVLRAGSTAPKMECSHGIRSWFLKRMVVTSEKFPTDLMHTTAMNQVDHWILFSNKALMTLKYAYHNQLDTFFRICILNFETLHIGNINNRPRSSLPVRNQHFRVSDRSLGNHQTPSAGQYDNCPLCRVGYCVCSAARLSPAWPKAGSNGQVPRT